MNISEGVVIRVGLIFEISDSVCMCVEERLHMCGRT